jgi:hypothetical protein
MDSDSKAEVFERTDMDQEPPVSEMPPRTEAGMNTPPPPPEEPPTANYENFDNPSPPPEAEAETEAGQPPEEPPEQNPESRQEVIVERHRAGVGAALMAFFAANWLSRRRDRKLSREARQMGKNFQKSQEAAEAERRYAREGQRKAENLREEQTAKLSRLERAQAEFSNRTEAKEGPVPLGEVLAATAYVKNEGAPIADKPETRERIIKEKSEAASSETVNPKEISKNAFHESVQDPRYERQNDWNSTIEAKADRQVRTVDSGRGKTESGQSALDAAEASLSQREDPDDFYKIPMAESSPSGQNDLYRQSVTAGVAVGLAVAVLVLAVYLLF